MADARASEQDFEGTHGKIRRGDIIGIEGKPGKCVWNSKDQGSLRISEIQNAWGSKKRMWPVVGVQIFSGTTQW